MHELGGSHSVLVGLGLQEVVHQVGLGEVQEQGQLL